MFPYRKFCYGLSGARTFRDMSVWGHEPFERRVFRERIFPDTGFSVEKQVLGSALGCARYRWGGCNHAFRTFFKRCSRFQFSVILSQQCCAALQRTLKCITSLATPANFYFVSVDSKGKNIAILWCELRQTFLTIKNLLYYEEYT